MQSLLQQPLERWLQACGLQEAAHPLSIVLLTLLVLLIAWLCDRIVRSLVIPLVEKVVSKTRSQVDDILFSRHVLNTAAHIVPAIAVCLLLPPVFSHWPVVATILQRLTAIFLTVMAVRLCLVFINAINSLRLTTNPSTLQYITSLCGVLRIVVVCLAVIIVAAIVLNRNPFTLVAGLGAASAILMLVFKDTIEGLVAGVRLTSAGMVHIGDWITMPSTGAHGIVISMNLTTVKVQNFDKTIITIPPTAMVNGSFQNWSGMQDAAAPGRRVAKVIHVDTRSIRVASPQLKQQLIERGYFTPDELSAPSVNLQLYRTYVERWLHTRPEVVTDGSAEIIARDMEGDHNGLPVQFYFFLRDKRWIHYEHNSAMLMEFIYAFANDFQVRIYERH